MLVSLPQDGTTKVCGGHDLNEYVKHSGFDHGSSVRVWPGVEEVKASASELLNEKAGGMARRGTRPKERRSALTQAETPSTVFV